MRRLTLRQEMHDWQIPCDTVGISIAYCGSVQLGIYFGFGKSMLRSIKVIVIGRKMSGKSCRLRKDGLL